MKIIKEIVLCTLIAITSLVLFLVLGSFYVAKEHSTFLNIIVWISTGLFAYLVFIFIPWFNRKKVYYLDGFALLSSFGIIVIICLASQYSFNDYLYLDAIAFLSGAIAVAQFILSMRKKIIQKSNISNIPLVYLNKISALERKDHSPAKQVVIFGLNKESFTLKEAAIETEIGERKTSELLKRLIGIGICSSYGKTNDKRYAIVSLINK